MLTKVQLDQLEEVLRKSEGTTRIQWAPAEAQQLLSMTRSLVEALFYCEAHTDDLMVEALADKLRSGGFGKKSVVRSIANTMLRQALSSVQLKTGQETCHGTHEVVERSNPAENAD